MPGAMQSDAPVCRRLRLRTAPRTAVRELQAVLMPDARKTLDNTLREAFDEHFKGAPAEFPEVFIFGKIPRGRWRRLKDWLLALLGL